MNPQTKQSPVPQVVVSRVINASREKLFDAWTRPEQMAQWFIPGKGHSIVSNDLRVGGKYSLDMVFKDAVEDCSPTRTAADGAHYVHTGEYLVIERPSRLVFSWNSPAVQNTQVSVDFVERGKGTEVTITHEFLDTEDARKSHTSGWTGCLDKLAEFGAA